MQVLATTRRGTRTPRRCERLHACAVNLCVHGCRFLQQSSVKDFRFECQMSSPDSSPVRDLRGRCQFLSSDVCLEMIQGPNCGAEFSEQESKNSNQEAKNASKLDHDCESNSNKSVMHCWNFLCNSHSRMIHMLSLLDCVCLRPRPQEHCYERVFCPGQEQLHNIGGQTLHLSICFGNRPSCV